MSKSPDQPAALQIGYAPSKPPPVLQFAAWPIGLVIFQIAWSAACLWVGGQSGRGTSARFAVVGLIAVLAGYAPIAAAVEFLRIDRFAHPLLGCLAIVCLVASILCGGYVVLQTMRAIDADYFSFGGSEC